MVAPGSTSKTTQSYPCCGPAQFNEILNLLLELLKIKTVSCECFFIDYAFLQHLSCEKLVFAFFGNPFFWLRRIQARSTLSIWSITFLKFWCAQDASQRSLFCIFNVLALDFFKIQESALPRITPLTFFSCQFLRASTHSWFLQHLSRDNRFS